MQATRKAQRPGRWKGPMAGNSFVLKHEEIKVDYTIGATPGIPALVYRDGSSPPKGYTPAQVTTDQTAAGTFVSVPLQLTTDVGGGRFGVFVPPLDLPSGQHVHFTTLGVYERFS